jgi:metallo-beta-lactamase family protein
MLTIQFLGAAGQVTGSKYFLRTSKHRGLLVDCGLFQGTRDLTQMNWDTLPIQISDVHNVVLTHAHLDHTGYLPKLLDSGFSGAVYSTTASKEVTEFILRDSAHLQMEAADHANRHGYSQHKPAKPLYTPEDAESVLTKFVTQERHDKKVLPDDISFEYHNAGHILGSNFILMEKRMDDGSTIKILFSGDVGREKPVYLIPKEDPPQADFVVCESTYGDRIHSKVDPQIELGGFVKDIIAKKQVLVVPAFAVDRAQELIYCLHNLIRAGEIPLIPTYIDSPMATGVTELYVQHCEEHTMLKDELCDPTRSPLHFESLKFVLTPQQSKSLNSLKGPAIIISAGGMATGGRILHHLLNRLPHADSVVLFTGYQGEGTLGRLLIEGAKKVTVLGQEVEVKAQVKTLLSFSGHADQGELISWLKKMPKAPKRIFLTHGEDSARTVFKGVIEQQLGWNVHMPKLDETIDLATI